jgi:hypothetical protein
MAVHTHVFMYLKWIEENSKKLNSGVRYLRYLRKAHHMSFLLSIVKYIVMFNLFIKTISTTVEEYVFSYHNVFWPMYKSSGGHPSTVYHRLYLLQCMTICAFYASSFFNIWHHSGSLVRALHFMSCFLVCYFHYPVFLLVVLVNWWLDFCKVHIHISVELSLK